MLEVERELTGAVGGQLMAAAWQISHHFEIIRRAQVVESFPKELGAAFAKRFARRSSVVGDGLQATTSKSNDHCD